MVSRSGERKPDERLGRSRPRRGKLMKYPLDLRKRGLSCCFATPWWSSLQWDSNLGHRSSSATRPKPKQNAENARQSGVFRITIRLHLQNANYSDYCTFGPLYFGTNGAKSVGPPRLRPSERPGHGIDYWSGDVGWSFQGLQGEIVGGPRSQLLTKHDPPRMNGVGRSGERHGKIAPV